MNPLTIDELCDEVCQYLNFADIANLYIYLDKPLKIRYIKQLMQNIRSSKNAIDACRIYFNMYTCEDYDCINYINENESHNCMKCNKLICERCKCKCGRCKIFYAEYASYVAVVADVGVIFALDVLHILLEIIKCYVACVMKK